MRKMDDQSLVPTPHDDSLRHDSRGQSSTSNMVTVNTSNMEVENIKPPIDEREREPDVSLFLLAKDNIRVDIEPGTEYHIVRNTVTDEKLGAEPLPDPDVVGQTSVEVFLNKIQNQLMYPSMERLGKSRERAPPKQSQQKSQSQRTARASSNTRKPPAPPTMVSVVSSAPVPPAARPPTSTKPVQSCPKSKSSSNDKPKSKQNCVPSGGRPNSKTPAFRNIPKEKSIRTQPIPPFSNMQQRPAVGKGPGAPSLRAPAPAMPRPNKPR